MLAKTTANLQNQSRSELLSTSVYIHLSLVYKKRNHKAIYLFFTDFSTYYERTAGLSFCVGFFPWLGVFDYFFLDWFNIS